LSDHSGFFFGRNSFRLLVLGNQRRKKISKSGICILFRAKGLIALTERDRNPCVAKIVMESIKSWSEIFGIFVKNSVEFYEYPEDKKTFR